MYGVGDECVGMRWWVWLIGDGCVGVGDGCVGVLVMGGGCG